MSLIIKGVKEHKGFMLKQSVELENDIVVLTGKNGSGKTRLLESLQNMSSEVCIDERALTNKEVMMVVAQAGLNPNFGAAYNDAQFQTKVTSTLQLYDRVKQDFDLPFEQEKAQQNNRNRESGLDYQSLFMLCASISNKLGKPASELSHDDIIFHFEEPLQNVLGIQSISTICNQYIKRRNLNQFNEWKSKEKKADVTFLSEKEFLREFGEPPWVLINRILEGTFEGKFYFNAPDEESLSYTYQAQLIQSDTLIAVGVNELSSGEKTLLWLALTLFNSQYYDPKMVRSPKVLLVDEPDAFLHPKMVVKMYKVLESFIHNFNSTVIISTHSPTTVALAPSESTYIIDDNKVISVEKDMAISELLDGVTQISLSPENRKQVFVESQYDANVYQNIFSKLVHRSEIIDPVVSLTFVSSGPKMPQQQIIDKVKQILKIDDEGLIMDFVQSINGIGNCCQVIGQVDALVENGNKSVRGIIDRDTNNKSTRNIAVLGEEYAYSIENITLDPICVMLLLHMDKPDFFTMSDLCGEDVSWRIWLDDLRLMQISVDRFIERVLGRRSKNNAELTYFSGLTLRTDLEYLNKQGHELEELLKEKYPQLNGFARSGKDGELKYEVVRKAMINFTDGAFIPKAFEVVLSQVQRTILPSDV